MANETKDTGNATWKFEFADTVQADPRANGLCLAVIRAYLNFASKSDPKAFCSISELMLRTAGSRPAVVRARDKLVELGYLESQYVTDEGATMYRLVNARKQLIDDHLAIARQSLAFDRRDRKRRERKRRGSHEKIPPFDVDLERNVTPVLNETLPNTVEESRRDTCSEGREGLREEGTPPSNDNPYGSIDDDPTIPFEVPQSEAEANEILSHFGNVNPVVRSALRRMLMAGELTPAFIQANLGGFHA